MTVNVSSGMMDLSIVSVLKATMVTVVKDMTLVDLMDYVRMEVHVFPWKTMSSYVSAWMVSLGNTASTTLSAVRRATAAEEPLVCGECR